MHTPALKILKCCLHSPSPFSAFEICDRACENQPSERKLHLVMIMNIFSSKRSSRMLLALKDSPLNSAFVVENLCGQFKRTINYDKTKLEKLGNFTRLHG